MSEWKQFEQYIRWQDLLNQYIDGLSHVERFKTQHPERNIPEDAYQAIQTLTALYQTLRPLIGNPDLLAQHAPPDAIKSVLGVVGRVRQQLPIYLFTGSA